MKQILSALLLLICSSIFAQKTCEYSTNVKDSIGTYKSTKEYLIYEKNFAGNKSYIFFSLALTDGAPTLNIQLIQKSKDFISANCFDKDSKLYFQLNNGKIVTLIYTGNESCGTLIRNDENFDNRLLTGNFSFLKGSIEDLKTSPVNLMRIKFLTDLPNYVFRKAFTAELDNKTYEPENYFMNFLHCID